MFKTSKRVATFYMGIVIVFTLYITVVLIHFFTKDSVTKETIVGINPVAETTSTMYEQEHLAVVIENKKTKPAIQEKREGISRSMQQTARRWLLRKQKLCKKNKRKCVKKKL